MGTENLFLLCFLIYHYISACLELIFFGLEFVIHKNRFNEFPSAEVSLLNHHVGKWQKVVVKKFPGFRKVLEVPFQHLGLNH
jgi:hypothetical protein